MIGGRKERRMQGKGNQQKNHAGSREGGLRKRGKALKVLGLTHSAGKQREFDGNIKRDARTKERGTRNGKT